MPVLNSKQEGVTEVRPAIPTDCVYIAQHMREADLMEIRAGGHTDPLLCLMDCFERTEKPFTGVWKGNPCCIFGVSRIRYRMFDQDGRWCPKGIGAPWMLGTDEVNTARWRFLRESRRWLDEVKGDYDHLWNRVHEKNTMHIRWLKWLGFQFGGDVVYPSGEVFREFTMRINHVHH
jgi:hypothetical protein